MCDLVTADLGYENDGFIVIKYTAGFGYENDGFIVIKYTRLNTPGVVHYRCLLRNGI